MGQRPHDYLTVSLCKWCHQTQHSQGEITFWQSRGIDVGKLIESFQKASPKWHEIKRHKEENE